MIKEGYNIRLWYQEVLVDSIIQYTQLALQLANLTATSRSTLVQTPIVKRAPTGNKRGRPKATELVARTNQEMDEFYRPVQSDARMPLLSQEEETKENGVEYIDTSSNPQPRSAQQPAEVRATGKMRV